MTRSNSLDRVPMQCSAKQKKDLVKGQITRHGRPSVTVVVSEYRQCPIHTAVSRQELHVSCEDDLVRPKAHMIYWHFRMECSLHDRGCTVTHVELSSTIPVEDWTLFVCMWFGKQRNIASILTECPFSVYTDFFLLGDVRRVFYMLRAVASVYTVACIVHHI